MSEPSPQVTKSVWTQADFASLGWHDCSVHALALQSAPQRASPAEGPGRLLIDLDYIIEWVRPTPPDKTFSFWICPSTLVFDHLWNVSGDLSVSHPPLTLDAIKRCDPNQVSKREPTYGHGPDWMLCGHEFTLELWGRGFTMYLRRRPILSAHLALGLDQRGAISFDEEGFIA